MEKKVLVICIIVGFLGLLTAVLGFAAEAKRIKISDVQITNRDTCSYPRSPAFALGSFAGLTLVIAQIIINTAAGCICCKKRPVPTRSNWTMALVCLVFSWITFVIAFLLLLTGAALNDQHGKETMYFGTYCYVVKPGVFSAGAVLSLATVALGIVYYNLLSSAKTMEPWGTHQNHGIAMAQPEIPPQSTQPVFVHEDTYRRQQTA